MPDPANASACSLLKDFEREARTDNMPASVLAERKKALADKLNALIEAKKELAVSVTKDDLFAGAAVAEEENLDSKW